MQVIVESDVFHINLCQRRFPFNVDGAFVDWVSILNQYCQSNRINQPKYYEETNPHGGFGSSVVVSSERFFSDCYADTKKKAKHYAARSALLGLNIPICKYYWCDSRFFQFKFAPFLFLL